MGVMSRVPVPALVAVAYLAILVVLTIAAPAAAVVFVGIGVVTLMPYLFMATARANNRRFEAARTDLAPGEEVRFWWKAGFPSMGARWVVVTTERLLIPRPALGGPRTRPIPFSEIYLADTSERAFGVGLLVATTLSSRYLELDLTNGDVVRVKVDRPHVLHQRLVDAVAEWAQRQTA